MDSDQGKLFVGGISWELKEETLKDHFQKYGEVVETVIMKDKATGSSRGFGFVQFSDPSAGERALQESHVILGKTVDVKKAVPKGERCQPHQRQQQSKGSNKNSASSSCRCTNYSVNQVRTKKIFVGGLSSNLTEEAFRSHFEKFGRITDVVVMYDSVTRRPRGFGFITFDSEEAVDNVMQKNFHQLNDKLVEVKRAVPKEMGTFHNGNSSYNMTMGSGRGTGYGPYEVYPPYSPRYGVFHGYPPAPFSAYGNASSYPYGVCPMGSGYGYGTYVTPIVPPRSPWNGLGIFDARRSPMPYGNAAVYPSYISGGVGSLVGASSGNYSGVVGASNGKWNQGAGARDVQTMVEGSNGGTPSTTPPCNGLGIFDARRSPMPYGNAAVYPSYINGGVGSLVGASSGNYSGVVGASNGKGNQGAGARDVQTMVEGSNGGTPSTTPPCMEGGKLDDGASSLDGSCGNGGGGDEQNERGPGAQHL